LLRKQQKTLGAFFAPTCRRYIFVTASKIFLFGFSLVANATQTVGTLITSSRVTSVICGVTDQHYFAKCQTK